MSGTSARLVTWENGTDLVIELPLTRDLEQVWTTLTDSDMTGSWFAPFHLGEEAAAEEEGDDEPAGAGPARSITFDLGEIELRGSVLSCETCDHVLLELDDFGVLGIRLVPLDTTDTAAPAVTLLVFTQTAPDAQSARLKAAEDGPMWDTHLRLFARTLGLEIAEVTEPELVETYSELELDDSGGDA